jgi:hypothetical protein
VLARNGQRRIIVFNGLATMAARASDSVRDNAPSAYAIYMFDPKAKTWLIVASPPPGFMLTDPVALQPRPEPNVVEPTTVDANLALGFGEDERDYGVAAHMLRSLGIRSIRGSRDERGLDRMRQWHEAAAADWKRLDAYGHPVATHFATTWQNAHPDIAGAKGIDLVLLDAFAGQGWGLGYLRWELLLLEELGFGLDLSRCAVTGSRDDLAFVSPKTGRAVSRQGAGDWADRLLPLPQGLLGQGPVSRAELAQGLAITGHFLARELSPLMEGRPLPEARGRLLDLFAKG